MTRGGCRQNAGAKPIWRHGKTKTIRVPVVLAEQILEYAHLLDEGNVVKNDFEAKVLNLEGITIPEIRNRKFVFLSDLVKLGYSLLPPRLTDFVRAEMDFKLSKPVSKLSKL